MTVGEMPGAMIPYARQYTGEDSNELQMFFQFAHMSLEHDPKGKWSSNRVRLADLRKTLSEWQNGLNNQGWNSLYWNNHDQPRVVSRFGYDKTEEKRVLSAKMLATILHMLQGNPYIYQGGEIGMTNVRFPSVEDYRDVEMLNAWHEQTERYGVESDKMMLYIYSKG